MPKNDKPAGGRRNVPLFITLPPDILPPDMALRLAAAVCKAAPKGLVVEIAGKDPDGKRQLRANKSSARAAANESLGITRAVPAHLRKCAAPAVDLGLLAAGYKTASQINAKPGMAAILAAAINAVKTAEK